VSSKTLGKDMHEELFKVEKFIKAIHHSDNNGFCDTNDLLNNNYWFARHISKFSKHPNVLEVKTNGVLDIESQIKLLQIWM